MQLLLDGEQIPLGTITVRESVFEYSATLVFQSFTPLAFEKITLVVDSETEYSPVRTEQLTQTAYQYTCYPKKYVEFLQKVTVPLNMEANVTDLLQALSLAEFSVNHNSIPLQHVLPSLRGKSIIDYLTRYSRFENGGCPTFHFGVSGGLIASDIISESLETYKGAFSGVMQKNTVSLASQNKNAGKVIFHFYDDNSYSTQEATFLEGAGITNLYRRVNSEAAKQLCIAEMQSKFWRNFVQNQVFQVTDAVAVGISPGIKVRSMTGEQEYVVTSTTTVIENNQPSTTLEVCRAFQPEQKI